MFGIDDAIAAGAKLVDGVVNRVWPDATEVEKAKVQQATQEIQNGYNLLIGQIQVNAEEAKNPSVFVAGARPAAIWVGVFSLLYSGIGVSFMGWIAACFGLPPIPVVDTSTQNTILMGLLGLGGMRTAEKLKGVETKKIGN